MVWDKVLPKVKELPDKQKIQNSCSMGRRLDPFHIPFFLAIDTPAILLSVEAHLP